MTEIRLGTFGDFPFIDSLRKKEGSALGFLPKDAYNSVLERRRVADRDRWKYQKIWIVEDEGDMTGFCYASFHKNPATIIQIVVQEDARRWSRAMMLEGAVEDETRSRGLSEIKCRVAYDLESNFYWKAIGYRPIETTTSTWLNQKESKSKRPIIVYNKRIKAPHQLELIY